MQLKHIWVKDLMINYYSINDIDINSEDNIGKIEFCINKNKCYIISLFVDIKYRNRGLGSKLFLLVKNYCIDNKINIIKLDSTTDMDDNRNLYIKHGMKYINKNKGPEMDILLFN